MVMKIQRNRLYIYRNKCICTVVCLVPVGTYIHRNTDKMKIVKFRILKIKICILK